MLKGGLGGMMKKAQEMQENMQKMQADLVHKKVMGQAGGGVVEVELNGHYGCTAVRLSADALQEDKDMLEALIAAAINNASVKVQEMTQSEMSKVTSGMGLPAGFKLPF